MVTRLRIGDKITVTDETGKMTTYLYCGVIYKGIERLRLLAEIKLLKENDVNSFNLISDEWIKEKEFYKQGIRDTRLAVTLREYYMEQGE